MFRKDVLCGPLAIERNFGAHGAFGADAAQADAQSLEGMSDGILNCGRFEAGMHHAVGALFVVAGAVGIPIGLVHQFVEGPRVAFAEQIAGLLPAEDGARRITPRRAVVGLVAREEIEEQAGLTE